MFKKITSRDADYLFSAPDYATYKKRAREVTSRVYCTHCEASLTETDLAVRRCTQCHGDLTLAAYQLSDWQMRMILRALFRTSRPDVRWFALPTISASKATRALRALLTADADKRSLSTRERAAATVALQLLTLGAVVV